MQDTIFDKPNQKFIIRTSGFCLYFFPLLMIMFAFAFYMTVKELIEKGFNWQLALGLIFYAWIIAFFYVLLIKQKIEIVQGRLSSQFTGRSTIWPNYIKGEIDLADIESITIARINYFEKHSNAFQSEKLAELIHQYRSLGIISLATGFTVLIFVASKNQAVPSIAISTKPFSKESIIWLTQELRKHNVSVNTEAALQLD